MFLSLQQKKKERNIITNHLNGSESASQAKIQLRITECGKWNLKRKQK